MKPLTLVLAAGLLATSLVAAEPPQTQATPASAKSPASSTAPKTTGAKAVEGTYASSIDRWTKPADRNAALKYWSAMSAVAPKCNELIGDLNYDEIGVTKESAEKNEKYKAAVEAYNGLSQELIAASKLTKCDFELEFEKGIGVLLPHLSKMRQAARMLRFVARRDLIEGKPDEAAEALAAILRMGNHVSRDGFLISTLVGIAMASVPVNEVDALIKSGKLTEAGRATLLEAYDAINTDDPMLMFDSLKGERVVLINWIKATFHGPSAGQDFARDGMIFDLTEGNDSNDPRRDIRRKLVEHMDELALAQELDRTRKAYDAMVTAWKSEDPKTALDALNEKVSNDEFGALAAVICPSVTRAYSGQQKFIVEMKATIEKLKAAKITPADPPRAQAGSEK